MNSVVCNKGCCSLKILLKNKIESNKTHYAFEKRKAGVFVRYENKILLTQSYNNYWGIPKGQMEMFDENTKVCAERELKEETGINLNLTDNDLYRIILDNCYVYKINVTNMDIVDIDNLANLDSTGIGWAEIECAFDFNLNYLTKKILTGINYTFP